jgi:FkbM family methyltransferase
LIAVYNFVKPFRTGLKETIAFRIWSAKQIHNRTTLRFWYMKQVCRGERELRLVHGLSDPTRTTLDIGSNRGLYAIAALRFSKKVIAFEPQPYFAAFLRRHLGTLVEVHECAVSDTTGTATLLVPADPRLHAEARLLSVVDRSPSAMTKNSVSVRVKTVRLDDTVTDQVGLMKIDVEGHELAVLSGAEKLIESCRPNIIIEIENRHRAGAMDDAVRWFQAKRYRGCYLTHSGLSPIEGIGADQHFGLYNYIFFPAERAPAVRPSVLAALSGVLRL